MKSKKIILGVTASVAIYRALDLIRRLQKQDVDVDVVMTPHATEFIRPLMFASLTGRDAWVDAFSGQMPHIHLAREASLIVVAPATMDFINKLAHGICDNLLLGLCHTAKVPVIVAPSMNPAMFAHDATQQSLQTLRQRGVIIVMPEKGLVLCGEVGEGRLAELERIESVINDSMGYKTPAEAEDTPWKNRPVLITAGPTRNYIDPVRFITNNASGKLGVELSRELLRRGARVQLAMSDFVSQPEGIPYVKTFRTHEDIARAYVSFLREHPDGVIFAAAAPSDFSILAPCDSKRPKSDMNAIHLKPLPDLLKTMCAQRSPDSILVGFCVETEQLESRARAKMTDKHCDFMIGNGPESMAADRHSCVLISAKDERAKSLNQVTKAEAAKRICDFVLGV